MKCWYPWHSSVRAAGSDQRAFGRHCPSRNPLALDCALDGCYGDLAARNGQRQARGPASGERRRRAGEYNRGDCEAKAPRHLSLFDDVAVRPFLRLRAHGAPLGMTQASAQDDNGLLELELREIFLDLAFDALERVVD
jgi:hypothetical protein